MISRDNVTLEVDAVIYYKVTDASRAIVEVEDFEAATLLRPDHSEDVRGRMSWTPSSPTGMISMLRIRRSWTRPLFPGDARGDGHHEGCLIA